MKRPGPLNTRNVILSLACSCFLFGGALLAQQPVPPKAAGGTLTIDLAAMHRGPMIWTG
jgi:hypothetical protein